MQREETRTRIPLAETYNKNEGKERKEKEEEEEEEKKPWCLWCSTLRYQWEKKKQNNNKKNTYHMHRTYHRPPTHFLLWKCDNIFTTLLFHTPPPHPHSSSSLPLSLSLSLSLSPLQREARGWGEGAGGGGERCVIEIRRRGWVREGAFFSSPQHVPHPPPQPHAFSFFSLHFFIFSHACLRMQMHTSPCACSSGMHAIMRLTHTSLPPHFTHTHTHTHMRTPCT